MVANFAVIIVLLLALVAGIGFLQADNPIDKAVGGLLLFLVAAALLVFAWL